MPGECRTRLLFRIWTRLPGHVVASACLESRDGMPIHGCWTRRLATEPPRRGTWTPSDDRARHPRLPDARTSRSRRRAAPSSAGERLADRGGRDRLDRRPRADRVPRGDATSIADPRRGRSPGEPRLDRQRSSRYVGARLDGATAQDARSDGELTARRRSRLDAERGRRRDRRAAEGDRRAGGCASAAPSSRLSGGDRLERLRRALRARAFGPQKVLGSSCPRPTAPATRSLSAAWAQSRSGSRRCSRTSPPILTRPAATGAATTRSARCCRSTATGWKAKIVLPRAARRRPLPPLLGRRRVAGRGAHARPASRSSAYREVVAATNFKQRTRKMLEYHHADRLDYAVVGTPNRLEYDQGFFVKNGDGAADVKPIAHLYKTQVYPLAEYLGVPGGDPQPAADDRHVRARRRARRSSTSRCPTRRWTSASTRRTTGVPPEAVAEAVGLPRRTSSASTRTSTRSAARPRPPPAPAPREPGGAPARTRRTRLIYRARSPGIESGSSSAKGAFSDTLRATQISSLGQRRAHSRGTSL